jgi:tetratricopeptide (TPR) repeat protein
MSRDEVRRDRLSQFVDLARIYRRWTKIQTAQALGREPSKVVPESGNPKLDLVVGLAEALDWDVGDVAEGIWRDEAEAYGEIETMAERGFAILDREAIEAHRAGEYRRMTELSRALFLAAHTGSERATAANRLAGAYDGLGRYTKALAALQRGLAEPGVPAHVRMMLEVNLANAHYALWHLVEACSVANSLVERFQSRPAETRTERVVQAFGHYVRGQSERRLIETDPLSGNSHAQRAREDLQIALTAYTTLAQEFDDASYAGIANTCTGAIFECDAALGVMDPLRAAEALSAGLDQVVDVVNYPPGDWLESYGWWAIFGCNVVLRGLSGPELHRHMAVFSNKTAEIAERMENWSMRERAFTFEHLRRQRMNESLGYATEWLLDDDDVRTVTGTMGRFPSFRETGWRILESARSLHTA